MLFTRSLKTTACAAAVALLLAACGGGDDDTTASTHPGTGTGATQPQGNSRTQRLTPQVWHWVATSISRAAMVAGEGVHGTTAPLLRVSRDSGATMSDNGSIMGATLSTTGTEAGRVMLSTDGGATWTARNPATNANWRSLAISGDGTRALAAAGLFGAPGTVGPLYTAP